MPPGVDILRRLAHKIGGPQGQALIVRPPIPTIERLILAAGRKAPPRRHGDRRCDRRIRRGGSDAGSDVDLVGGSSWRTISRGSLENLAPEAVIFGAKAPSRLPQTQFRA